MPSVNRLHQDFKAQGFELLLISFREGPEAVRKLMNEERYTAPVLLDPSGDIAGKVYGVWGPGTKFFIDRQGIVRYIKVEENPLERLKPDALLKALKESGI